MCLPLGRLFRGHGSLFSPALMVCHCLLIETDAGLVLIDTGLGLADIAAPAERLGKPFTALVRPVFDPKETAIRQVEALGFAASDVRHIVLTHLDLDHAGGLSDFPEAEVHVYRPEHEAAMAPPTFRERERYRKAQWAHGSRWNTYEAGGEPWFGFDCVRQLRGLPPEILIVPMIGHSRGHAAIAVHAAPSPSARDDAPWSHLGGWLLHAGDAYFYRGEMDPNKRTCPVGLEVFQRALGLDNAARVANQARLRAFARDRSREVRVFCAHDGVELERCRATSP